MEMREKVTSVLTVLAGFKNLLGFVLLLMMLILGNWTYGYPSADLYDISRSWFNPSLAVDNDPEISKPLLSGYTHFFRSYLSHLPGAEQEISRFYAEKFNLPEEDTGPLANSAISYALAVGFDHGCVDDEANEHHRRGLNQGHSSSGFLPLMRHSRLFP